MNIREVSSQFTVYIFSGDIDRGAGIKVALGRAGYETFFFEDRETVLSRIAEKAPHLLIFPTSSLKESLSDFVEAVLKTNADVRFICLAKPSQYETLAEYNEYGMVDLLSDDGEGLNARVVFSVDRACERLYLQYQNEQLFDAQNVLRENLVKIQAQLQAKEHQVSRQGPPLEARIKDYLSAESKEDLLRRFMAALAGTPCMYFKYLPTVRSLLVTHASGFSPDSLQGLGCQLTAAENKDFETQVTLNVVVPSLAAVLSQAFQFPQSRVMPLFVHGQLEGLVAFPSSLSEPDKDRVSDETSLLALAYSNFTLEKRVDTLEVQDAVTEVYNAKFYGQRLTEEWNRSRRIQQGLSLVKVALDDFYELEQTLGEAVRDQLLKNLADLIVKTSRTNDTTCRTGQNEFSLILPHCNRQGATIRAERLRRLVESTQMLENGLKISISLGISEYPTLCSTPQALDQTAAKALAHIMDKGGNKLCLFKAPSDHQPDFEVSAEPVS